MRWPLLRRGSRVRGRARQKLNVLLASKLATARAWDLKETFTHFWKYKSEMWAGGFLDYWCFRALRSRLEPMKRVARMLRAHEPLILNWFRAKGLGYPDPGSRQPIPASTPCAPIGLPVPCATAAQGTSKIHARESFRRTCERSAGYPTAISSSGRHLPPSTIARTSAPPRAPADPSALSA